MVAQVTRLRKTFGARHVVARLGLFLRPPTSRTAWKKEFVDLDANVLFENFSGYRRCHVSAFEKLEILDGVRGLAVANEQMLIGSCVALSTVPAFHTPQSTTSIPHHVLLESEHVPRTHDLHPKRVRGRTLVNLVFKLVDGTIAPFVHAHSPKKERYDGRDADMDGFVKLPELALFQGVFDACVAKKMRIRNALAEKIVVRFVHANRTRLFSQPFGSYLVHFRTIKRKKKEKKMIVFRFKIFARQTSFHSRGEETKENCHDWCEIDPFFLSYGTSYEVSDRIEYFLKHTLRIQDVDVNFFYGEIKAMETTPTVLKEKLDLYDNKLWIEKDVFISFSV